jgi:hypothetical protein
MQCACYIAESDDNNPLRLNPCPDHERWAKAIRNAERQLCIAAAEGEPLKLIAPAHDAWDRGYQAGRGDATRAIINRST